MIFSRSKKAAAFAVAMASLAGLAPAQLSLTAPGTPAVIDFTGFAGGGLSPTPAAGQLNSNTFRFDAENGAITAFGDTVATGVLARGNTGPGVATGGVYGCTIDGSTVMNIQPVAANFTPGSVIVRVQNNTGSTLNRIDVSYKCGAWNDQASQSTWQFSHGSVDGTWTSEASLD